MLYKTAVPALAIAFLATAAQATETLKVWTNPETQVGTVLPKGWVETTWIFSPISFRNESRGLNAKFRCENQPEPEISLRDYAEQQHFAAIRWATLAGIDEDGDETMQSFSGSFDTEGRVKFIIARVAAKFCTIEYTAAQKQSFDETSDHELTKALLITANGSQQWTNPQSGVTVTIPDGWKFIYHPEGFVLQFTNSARQQTATYACTNGASDSIEQFIASLKEMAATAMPEAAWLGNYSPYPDPEQSDLWMASGTINNNANFNTVIVGMAGSYPCSIEYKGPYSAGTTDSSDAELTRTLLKSGWGDLIHIERAEQQAREMETVLSRWTNPLTGKSVPIPANWIAVERAPPPMFVHRKDTRIAELVCDQVPDSVQTINDYVPIAEARLKEDYTLSPFTSAGEADRLVASGTVTSNDTPVSVVLGKVGSRFCSINYAVLDEARTTEHQDPALNKAIFKSFEF